MSGNSELAESDNRSYQSSEIDKLLNSGKITNAVDFLHYFKNKQFSAQPQPTAANVSNGSPQQQQQANVMPEKSKRQKKSKSNLSDYVNIIQPLSSTNTANGSSNTNNKPQMKHNNSFNNGIPSHNKANRHKKTFSSNNISGLATANIKHANSNMSLSSLSIPDRQSPSPNPTQIQTQPPKSQFNKQRKAATNPIPQTTDSIFTAYQINDTLAMPNPAQTSRPGSSSALEPPGSDSPHAEQIAFTSNSSTTNTSPTPSHDPSVPFELTPAANTTASNISAGGNSPSMASLFLKNSAFYQKYQAQHQPQMCLQSYGTSSASAQIDRKKEEAINRIIRNEKIKQIRTKMFEYELLKEYGALNPLPSNLPSDLQLDNINNDSSGKSVHDPSYLKAFIPINSKAVKKLKRQQSKANNLFSSYNIEGNDDSDSDDKSSMSSQTNNNRGCVRLQAQSGSTFDKYKDEVFGVGKADEDDEDRSGVFYGDTTNEDEEEDFLFSDGCGNRDDENYESGIEEDSGFCKLTDSQLSSVSHGQSSRAVNGSGNKGRKVKPGYERYDIGSVNCFGLSAFAQSTFHLKCSIINTEVKNIMNVLKQV